MAWMSEDAAATVLGVSFRTLRRRIGNGTIKAMRQGQQIFVDVEVSGFSAPAAQAQPSPTVSGALFAGAPVAQRDAAPGFAPQAFQPISFPAPMPQGAVVRSRWVLPVIWILVTALLSCGVLSAWLYHQNQMKLQAAEYARQRVIDNLESSGQEQRQALESAQQSAIAKECEWQMRSSEMQAGMDELAYSLNQGMTAMTGIQSRLAAAQERAHVLGAERNRLARELMTAQIRMTGMQLQAGLGRLAHACQDWRDQWARSVETQAVEAEEMTLNDIQAPEAQAVVDQPTERVLPDAPAEPSQPTLTPILRSPRPETELAN